MKLHLRAMGCQCVTCDMGCQPTQVSTPRLNPSQRQVFNLPTLEGWKAELLLCLVTICRWVNHHNI